MPSSASAYFGLGIQSAQGTPATSFYQALSTVSRMAPERRERQARIVHPAASQRSTRDKAPTSFSGFLAGANVTFPLYPKMIGAALIGCGFGVVAADQSTYKTQTFTIADDTVHKWMSAVWYMPTSTPAIHRAVDGRVSQLNVNGTVDEIMCDLTMSALSQAILTPAPTLVTEKSEEILPWIGSRTLTMAGYTITEAVQGLNMQIINTLNQDKRSLWVEGNTDLPRRNIAVEVALTGIDLSKSIFGAAFYGSAAGTTVSTAPVTGSLTWEWRSANNITGAAVPYRFSVTMPSVQFIADPNSMGANNDDDMVINITARMNDDVTTPITIVFDTDVAAYS